jgi:hypothetical protein
MKRLLTGSMVMVAAVLVFYGTGLCTDVSKGIHVGKKRPF